MWVRCGRMFGIYACFICFSYLAFILGFMLGAIWVLLRFTLGSSFGVICGFMVVSMLGFVWFLVGFCVCFVRFQFGFLWVLCGVLLLFYVDVMFAFIWVLFWVLCVLYFGVLF